MMRIITVWSVILGVLGSSGCAHAGGARNFEGKLLIPVVGTIVSFTDEDDDDESDDEIEIKHQNVILLMKQNHAGMPVDLEPKIDDRIEVQLTVGDLNKILLQTSKDKAATVDLR